MESTFDAMIIDPVIYSDLRRPTLVLFRKSYWRYLSWYYRIIDVSRTNVESDISRAIERLVRRFFEITNDRNCVRKFYLRILRES